MWLLNSFVGRKAGQAIESDSTSADESEDDVLPGARPNILGTSDPPEEDEEASGDDDELVGFIEEDGNAAVELPAEFSMNTYQDLMHHFKIICQLFVHLAIQPPEYRQIFMTKQMKGIFELVVCLMIVNTCLIDQYFAMPLQVARRKITGMRDSLVTSSVWRTDFKKSLETFPEFETVRMEFAVPNCDACHLGGRMSTLIGRVFGEPYDKVTFEVCAGLIIHHGKFNTVFSAFVGQRHQ